MMQIKNMLSPLQNKITYKNALFSKEVRASYYIPYAHFNSESFFETRDGWQGCVIKVRGVPYDTVDKNTVNHQQQCLNTAIQQLTHEYVLYVTQHHCHYDDWPDEKLIVNFANDFNKAYYQQLKNKPLFITEYYLTLLIKPNFEKLNLLKTLTHRYLQTELQKARRIQTKKIMTASHHLMASLVEYQPQLLASDSNYSEVLNFLGRLVNLENRSFLFPQQDIASFIPSKRLFFGSHAIQAIGNTKEDNRFAAMLAIKHYAPQTTPGLLNQTLQLPFEMIMTHSFRPIAKNEALNLITKQKNRLQSVDDAALSEQYDLNQAQDDVVSNRISFGFHHHTVMVMADSLQALDAYISQLTKTYQDNGLVITRESLNLECAFWAQLPGNLKYNHRATPISSHNFTCFCSLHHDAIGYRDKNHLGGALVLTRSRHNTPYYLNLHEPASGRREDLSKGFTTLIGPANAGKTAFMLSLDIMFQKYGVKSYIFDRNHGCELYVRVMQGSYFSLEPVEVTGWNPCQLEDNANNRAFLCRFLQILVSDKNSLLTASDENQIANVVERNFTLPKEKRNLSTLASFFNMDFKGLESLQRWLNTPDKRGKVGDYAYIFDNKKDTFNFDGNTLGFDMTYLLGQVGNEALTPVMMYLFHRIEQNLDGRLTGIYLDEGWQCLNHPYWAAKIVEYQVTFRKLNAFIIFATQSPDTIAKSALRSALIQGSATNLYLPNPKADATDYIDGFKLSEREFALVKNASIQSRQVLIKQGNESIVVNFDLSELNDFLAILSGTKESVNLVASIRKEVGEDPNNWLPIFHERRRS